MFPEKRILASKLDLKSAHRRVHLCGSLVATSLTIVGAFALISLRLPFGEACCPHWWCAISELICGVANALLRCEFWNPADFDFSNKKVIPECEIDVKDNPPFVEALPIDVLVDPDDRGKSFCSIDDLITVGLENAYIDKLRYAVALVIDFFGRPLDQKEPIHRDDVLSMKKLQAEGALEECKTILGWFF